MQLASFFNINQDIIQIKNNKDIKLFSKNIVNVSLEASWNVRQTKKHHLIFKVTIPNVKCCLLLITFLNFYLMISISQVQLSKYFMAKAV